MSIAFLRPALVGAAIIASGGILAGGLALGPAFAVGGSAYVGPFVVMHCTSNSACQQFGNQGTGIGVQGNNTNKSTSGVGVEGMASGGGTGVNGQAITGYGVAGSSTSSIGVFGSSYTGTAIQGETTAINGNSGVSGISNGTSGTGHGLYGRSANGEGVYGISTDGGDGVFGTSTSGYGVSGASTSSLGVSGTSTDGTAIQGETSATDGNSGVSGISNGTTGSGHGVYGRSSNGEGVYGSSTASNAVEGVSSAGGYAGVAGFQYGSDSTTGGPGVHAESADNTGEWPVIAAYGDNKFTSLFFAENKVTGANCGIGYDAVLACSGTADFKAYRARHVTSTGQHVLAYASESTSATLEDFGTAQMIDGVANVAIESRFAATIDRTAGYYVFLTPLGDTKGLFVSEKTPAGFQVRETQGGRSTIAFDYRIVARPLDAAGGRLPIAPEMRQPRN
jgi:hypothetical protein